MKSAICA